MNKDTDLNMERKILDAAQELFLDKGFEKTSTTEIAKKAGCNQALVHYYFRTKENLFHKIFVEKFHMFGSAFLGVKKQDAGFIENLKNMISAHFDILAKMPKLPLLLLTDMIGNKERLKLLKDAIGAIPEKIFSTLGEGLDTEIAKGNIRPISAVDLMVNILSLNAFLFVSLPLFSEILEFDEEKKQKFIEHRKQEIIQTVISSIKP